MAGLCELLSHTIATQTFQPARISSAALYAQAQNSDITKHYNKRLLTFHTIMALAVTRVLKELLILFFNFHKFITISYVEFLQKYHNIILKFEIKFVSKVKKMRLKHI